MLKSRKKSRIIKLVFLILFLVVVGATLFDYYIPTTNQKIINPPTRNIVHNEDVGKITQFNLKIEKLGLDVPVIPNVDGKNKDIYNKSLESGVAHYLNTALPNSGSNIVIFGHSSTTLGVGKYGKIFATLNKLEQGDKIIINFNYREYKYAVNEKKIVLDTDFSVIVPTEHETLTLLTCWPIGTDDKRLVIIAKPIK